MDEELTKPQARQMLHMSAQRACQGGLPASMWVNHQLIRDAAEKFGIPLEELLHMANFTWNNQWRD